MRGRRWKISTGFIKPQSAITTLLCNKDNLEQEIGFEGFEGPIPTSLPNRFSAKTALAFWGFGIDVTKKVEKHVIKRAADCRNHGAISSDSLNIVGFRQKRKRCDPFFDQLPKGQIGLLKSY